MAFFPFSRGRMPVGYRLRDWSPVYYERLGQPDMDGTAEIGLFKLSTGEAGWREPMEGEVAWFPVFDPARCESKVKREREAMQKQTLSDAYTYLNERDPIEVKKLEETLDQRNFIRWHSWFREAKKWKSKNLKARKRRRDTRTARFAGVGLDEEVALGIDSESSSDDGDDGYDTDHERPRRRKKSRANGTGPPGGSDPGEGRQDNNGQNSGNWPSQRSMFPSNPRLLGRMFDLDHGAEARTENGVAAANNDFMHGTLGNGGLDGQIRDQSLDREFMDTRSPADTGRGSDTIFIPDADHGTQIDADLTNDNDAE